MENNIKYKSASFLDKYDTILFDMDGVITSEEAYWKSAALTLFEFLNSKKYYGSKDIDAGRCMLMADELTEKYFCDGRIIKFIKNKGINNNWDLAYIVLAVYFHIDEEDNFEAVLDYLKELDMDGKEMCDHAGKLLSEELCVPLEHVKRFGDFWTEIQHCFQEWFLGNRLFQKEWFVPSTQEGKTGLMYMEKPIVDKEKLSIMLETLSKTHTLGIGTGRPITEAISALEGFNIRKYFDESRIISHNYIVNAEENLKEKGKPLVLAKPHPFMFLKGTFGAEISDYDILEGKYDKDRCLRTLVVGDAVCDLDAAFAGGCDFAAVLTGVQKKDAKDVFIAKKATYILDDILSLVKEV
ncbi:MAG: hypothetical protein E7398_03740 [Ruminococcaceae bacterium]|nr:hypothetical protein [Oscillospiraceae bacterium]